MRQTTGGTWITQLVIIFMFLFVAFLALSINYSKAYRVKNQTLSIIEKKQGINANTVRYINSYLRSSGYNMKGYCGKNVKNMYGVTSLDDSKASQLVEAKKGTKYYYCLYKNDASSQNFKRKANYGVILFFKFNLPVMGEIYTFSVDGETKDIIYPDDWEGSCDKPKHIKCRK